MTTIAVMDGRGGVAVNATKMAGLQATTMIAAMVVAPCRATAMTTTAAHPGAEVTMIATKAAVGSAIRAVTLKHPAVVGKNEDPRARAAVTMTVAIQAAMTTIAARRAVATMMNAATAVDGSAIRAAIRKPRAAVGKNVHLLAR